jgi:hypothetical protein
VAEEGGGAAAHAVADQLLGQRAEVDVGAVGGPVQRHRGGEVTLGGHERQATGELGFVVDELGGGEQRVRGQRIASFAQVFDTFGAFDVADVRHRIEEAADVGEHSVVDSVGPELS